MSLNEYRSRVEARIWKAIAQSDIDLTSLSEKDQERLVELVTDAALLEIDVELDDVLASSVPKSSETFLLDDESDEQILWEGRPFLSISTHYVITSQRIRIVSGLLGKERQDVELIRVQDIGHKQTFRERMLGVGDITIKSHDSSHPDLLLNNVRDPENVHEILRQAVNDFRKAKGLSFQEEM
jgi:predicted nucleotidyltransferase